MSKSKDIRSFFQVVSKKPSSKPIVSKPIVLSDDEEIVRDTPDDKFKKKYGKRKIICSDSDEEVQAKPTSSKSTIKETDKPKLVPVDINDAFSNTPIKQSKVEYVTKETSKVDKNKDKSTSIKTKKKNTESDVHKDENFGKTLELEDDLLFDDLEAIDKSISEALATLAKPDKSKVGSSVERDKAKTREVAKTNLEVVNKRPRKFSDSGSETPSKRKKLEHVDSGIDPDQERFEKRRQSAALYQRYLNRGEPKHRGEKEYPKGKPDCLKNLTFLRTGVLDSLGSDEFENLVTIHGGRVVLGVSKKVNYIVVGDDAGPSKLQKARDYNIPEISEDDLLDMILVKSGMKPRFKKNVSEDAGIDSGDDSTTGLSDLNEEAKQKVEKKGTNGIKDQDKPITDLSNKNTESQTKSPKNKQQKLVDQKSHKDKVPKERSSGNSPGKKSEKQKTEEKDHHDNNVEIEKIVKDTTSDIPLESQSSKFTNIAEKDDLDINKAVGATQTVTDQSSLAWTDKYKPTSIRGIIGQQDPKSSMNKLLKWLSSWFKNQLPDVKKKLPRPTPWNQLDGAYYKCALLSGPPGVGKTTTAILVAKDLGLDIVEFNASDTRSKNLLNQQVSQLLSTNTIAGYAVGAKNTNKNRVLIMDEVDGMAGNEDRGGIQELISLIKTTSIPIICICNDRNHQKLRTLITYCYDLRFNKPLAQQIRGAMQSICFKENLQLKPEAISELINGTGCDIRQTLNHLSLWSISDNDLSVEAAKKESKKVQKDVVFGPWEVIKKVFNEHEQKDMAMKDKFRLFFYDYSFGPLFVQENYLNVEQTCSKKEKLLRASQAANAISRSVLIESKIRSLNNWSLLETQALFASVLPGHYMSGTLKGTNFPSWLGKNSKKNKLSRMLSELHCHTRTSITGNRRAVQMDYLVPLRDAIVNPLKLHGIEGIHQSVGIMKTYTLLREDLNNILELCQWKNSNNPFNSIESKVKAAFTRVYNKEVPLFSFAAAASVAKKKASVFTEGDFEDNVESDIEDDDNIETDNMIKKKVAKDKKVSSKPSTSKGKESKGKGKGKKK